MNDSMKASMQAHLINKIIPFWKSLRDDENGGYYGYMDYDLVLDKKAVKGCILNSRILWFFASAYNCLKDESLLHEAAHAFEFLRNHCIDLENGGVYWSLYYDGSVFDSTKHTYNQAFAIYALSAYYEASGNPEALKLALSIFTLIESRCVDDVGYLEAFDRSFQPVSNEKLSENGVEANKTMNTMLHVFEAYTALYRVTQSEIVGQRLRYILDVFTDKIYNPVLRRQEVFFDQHLNSLIDLHSYGHDIESAWLLDLGCDVLGDDSYRAKIEPITKALTQKVYESAYRDCSLLNECHNGVEEQSRVWWVQAEAVIGFLNGYQRNIAKIEYLRAAQNIWTFIQNYLIDQRAGSEWFWKVDESGKAINKEPIVEPWKCPYHNGRMCFEVMRRM